MAVPGLKSEGSGDSKRKRVFVTHFGGRERPPIRQHPDGIISPIHREMVSGAPQALPEVAGAKKLRIVRPPQQQYPHEGEQAGC